MLLAIAVGFASAACGDDNPSVQDAKSGGDAPDAMGSNATFTSFVINLVKNVSPNSTPAPFSSFSSLPDPDGSDNNLNAYDSLF
jgi:hypothetical protein